MLCSVGEKLRTAIAGERAPPLLLVGSACENEFHLRGRGTAAPAAAPSPRQRACTASAAAAATVGSFQGWLLIALGTPQITPLHHSLWTNDFGDGDDARS